jgi:uncharacterized protein
VTHDDRKRAVGKVVSVATDRFVVEIHVGTDNFTVVGFDDVHYGARLGSCLMIPTQSEYVVAEIVGLRERDVSGPSDHGDFDRERYDANYQYGNFQGGNQAAFLDVVRRKLREDVKLPSYDHTPFSFGDLEECLDFAILYDEAHSNRQIRNYCSSMVTRLKSLQERAEYTFLRHVGAEVRAAQSVSIFLAQIVGLSAVNGGHTKKHQVVIIDMNSVKDKVVELVSAVIARMLFRLLRRADPRNRFPIHLLLEEAHRYVASTPSRYAIDATKIFERVAKEGRKYGMFVMLESQWPSEISKTVLSQCSNAVVHRIQNPDDLAQIRQMTPFISDAVLKRLPSFPKQRALVFGTSVNLPTTFKVREASLRPRSDGTKVVDLWFHEEGRVADIRLASGGSAGANDEDLVQAGDDFDVEYRV